jgi:hypothetical protein
MIQRPELLASTHIPKPLHGLNPRTLLGKTWWDAKRQEVYASTGFTCACCGVPKADAKKHKWLEAHEIVTVNYSTGICEIKEIVPLCHYCHMFIHSGFLFTTMGKRNGHSKAEVKKILEHGLWWLKLFNLKCFPTTLELAEDLDCDINGVEAYELPKSALPWKAYTLLFQGKTYKSKFKNANEWRKYYSK